MKFSKISFFLSLTLTLICSNVVFADQIPVNHSEVPAVNKTGDNYFENMNIDLLKEKLKLNSSNITQESATIDLDAQFNAFPQTSTINMTLLDIDLPSVLRILAKQGGKNIIIDESVKGSVNAELKNVSLNEAMQMILSSKELESRVEGSTIFIASRAAMAKKGLNRKYIKIFKLNNANAVDVAKLLEASIFNKGYAVDDKAGSTPSSSQSMYGSSMPNSGFSGMPQSTNYSNTPSNSPPSSFGTTTGQSKLVSTKTIRGQVETMDSGSGFNDAGALASTIKIQNTSSTIQNIEVSNNDGGAVVIPDTRTNSVLVAGLKDDILLAQKAIACIDKPLPQVSMEVSLIELTKEDNNNLGLGISGHAGYIGSGYNTAATTAGSTPPEGAGLLTGADNAAFTFSSIRSIADSIAFKINAEVLTNKAKLLANPTVISLDGSESLIKITDQIVSKMTVTSQSTTGTVVYTPELSDIGIVLNITPRVGEDGYITMKVRPSITTFLKNVTFGSDGYANLISTREVILQATRVKSGETLAIAGLLKESDINQLSKLPYAADLPVFGKLFQNKTDDHTKSEIIILITPKIIGDNAVNSVSL